MKSHVVIFQHNGETKKKKEFSRTTANFFLFGMPSTFTYSSIERIWFTVLLTPFLTPSVSVYMQRLKFPQCIYMRACLRTRK